MFEARRSTSTFTTILVLCELIFVGAVRKVRQHHSNAVLALALNVLQVVLFVAAFYVMFTVLGTRNIAIRGNFVLYLMSGIFIYFAHIKALAAVMTAEGPTSAIMQHAPMNTIVAIASSALSALYIQVLSMVIILFAVHVAWEPVHIDRPAAAFGMFLLGWLSGVSVGVILLALKPWIPDLVSIFQQIWSRANMIASGKMFVANMMTTSMLAMFDWNPLFHVIDQARGFAFVNYNPHFSNMQYPLYVCLTLIVLGLMAEFSTRKSASLSWSARR